MVILDGDDWGTMVMDSEIDITGDTRMRGGYIRDDELNVNKMIAPSVEENQQQHTKECDKMTFENKWDWAGPHSSSKYKFSV